MQLENIGNFIKAVTKYGVKPHDIFEANDLFENTNHTQVQSTLLALASMVSACVGCTDAASPKPQASSLQPPTLSFLLCPPPQAKTKGNKVNVGVKYAEKQERKFEPEKLRQGRNIIGLQVGYFPRRTWTHWPAGVDPLKYMGALSYRSRLYGREPHAADAGSSPWYPIESSFFLFHHLKATSGDSWVQNLSTAGCGSLQNKKRFCGATAAIAQQGRHFSWMHSTRVLDPGIP